MSHRRNSTIYLKIEWQQQRQISSEESLRLGIGNKIFGGDNGPVLHMDNTFPLAGNCCNRYSNRTKSRNWRWQCESMSAINRTNRPYSSAEHLLRSLYLCCCRWWWMAHCFHSIWTFSHNAHGLRHRLRHLSIIHIAVGTQSHPDIWSSLSPSCACERKIGCPGLDIGEIRISTKTNIYSLESHFNCKLIDWIAFLNAHGLWMVLLFECTHLDLLRTFFHLTLELEQYI